MADDTIEVRVDCIRHEADGVLSLELRPYGLATLPAFSAGSHVDLHLGNGLVRSYSLMNRPEERECLRIGVYKDPQTRGGSKYIHDHLRPGQLLRSSLPRNNFPLAEEAGNSVFIAGGIGVTPFRAMISRLNELGKPWRLYYCAEREERAGFLADFRALAQEGNGEFVTNFDGVPGGKLLDMAAVVAKAPSGTHFYCCGPTGMLTAYRDACRDLPQSQVHFEYFSADVALAAEGGFEVVLAKSGKRIQVPAGNTILDALTAEGIPMPYSCQQGICGACETPVLSGIPDHRDMILSDEERASGKTILVCCSGSLSDELVLDI
ncbi:MAG TPA: PDR/VanB family oxidoreductase [Novosphingobium sp.]|nr:PDR/VanB family oxidoreductase [Novosphingobium sp.]